MTNTPGIFAAVAFALYVAHHVGDYWIQTDHQARNKGCAGGRGRLACAMHVLTYCLTQYVCVIVVLIVLEMPPLNVWQVAAGLGISAVTHYMADRREHGLMFKLARLIPGKANFLMLGVPRTHEVFPRGWADREPREPVPLDNPSLGTGAWALDQSWHIFWGFVAALVMVA